MAIKATQYMLVLRAYPDNWASLPSEAILVSAAEDKIAPKAPSALEAEGAIGVIVLTWTYPTLNADDSTCNDLSEIYVYRSGSSGIDISDPETYTKRFRVSGETYTYDAEAEYGDGRYYKCVLDATGAVQATTTSDRGYRGRGVKKQYFVVTAVDTTGNQSVASTEVNATPTSSSDQEINQFVDYRIIAAATDHTIADKIDGDHRLHQEATVLDVGAYCDTAGAGSVTTIDILVDDVSILSTLITIDAGEKTSTTADVAPVVSSDVIAAGGIITFNIDGIASGTAGKGLTPWLQVRM